MSVNKVILVGNLGKDPEVRFTNSGSAVARLAVATSEVWNDRDGNRQERTEWHNVVVWGKQGEHCGQYLAKGRQVYVEGSIRTRSYDDKSGTKRYVTEVVAQRVQFLGGGGGTRLAQQAESAPADDTQSGGGQPPIDDDVPF
ncbi:MAG: single-stranded DNA-binding protein [Deltaproteobacteria bacterium]|nr:single-stranded DNA-binding protein [Deltaproteobacteria bacterium]MDZ4343275.1 single-stranded DNA-binding protein [Candidatus Binatia bacterium]